jgi:ketosteroid isomerase-like protein
LKRLLTHGIAGIVTVSLPLFCFTIARAGREPMPQDGARASGISEQLRDVDKQWLHAATVQDTAFLKEFFAKGMFEVQKGGVVETGEEMQKVIGTPGRHIQIEIDDVVARGIYGDTAIITDRTRQEGTAPDGRKVSGEYTVMRILRKQAGKWRALGAQMTPLKPSSFATPMTHEVAPTVAANQTEKELLAIDHNWVDAATNGDTGYLKSIFTDQMFEVEADGHVADTAEMLKGIGTRSPGQFEGYCDQIQIRGIYEDTAVLTDRRVLKGKAANGQTIDAQWRVTRVLVKQQGKWRAAASALTTIDREH